jgi:rhodanese-related sulfurtransferase
MAHHPTLDLLDGRTPDDFAEVRVPRAWNIPFGILLAGKLLAEKAVDRRRPIT